MDLSILGEHAILTAMLAPALLMAATGSLLISANTRLARVVDRLRALIKEWKDDAPDREQRDGQIRRHRIRAHLGLDLLHLGAGRFHILTKAIQRSV